MGRGICRSPLDPGFRRGDGTEGATLRGDSDIAFDPLGAVPDSCKTSPASGARLGGRIGKAVRVRHVPNAVMGTASA